MNDIKWLKRKYPDSFELLNEYFDRFELRGFKNSNNKIGVLERNITQCQEYKKGSIIQFRRSQITDYNHPYVHCIVKCQVGYTESGYHSFNIMESDFKELAS